MYKILDDKGKTVHTVPTFEEAHQWISDNNDLLLFPECLYHMKKVKEAKRCL